MKLRSLELILSLLFNKKTVLFYDNTMSAKLNIIETGEKTDRC